MWRFAFQLCQLLGVPHPNRLSDPPWSLSWDEFLQWFAVWELDCWSPARDDMRQAALLVSLSSLIDSEIEVPSPLWPYFDDDEGHGLDELEALEAFRSHRLQYGFTMPWPK